MGGETALYRDRGFRNDRWCHDPELTALFTPRHNTGVIFLNSNTGFHGPRGIRRCAAGAGGSTTRSRAASTCGPARPGWRHRCRRPDERRPGRQRSSGVARAGSDRAPAGPAADAAGDAGRVAPDRPDGRCGRAARPAGQCRPACRRPAGAAPAQRGRRGRDGARGRGARRAPRRVRRRGHPRR